MEYLIKKRLFIALNLPQAVTKELDDIISKLSKSNNGVKWVNGKNVHLTLHFLGYLNEDKVEQIKLIMQSFQGKFGQLEFELGRVNAFPNLDKPRVIFLECKQINSKSVFKLHELLAKKIVQLGIRVDSRKWKPHLTLGRVKQPLSLKISPDMQLVKTTFSVNAFELIESTLKPAGAEYKEVISYKL